MLYPPTNFELFPTLLIIQYFEESIPTICKWGQGSMIYGYGNLRMMFSCGQSYANLSLNPTIQDNTNITPKHEFKKLSCGF